MTIYLIITQSCTCHCSFCIRKSIPNQTEMLFNDAITGLVKLSSFYPDATIILTGGEPTMHSRFHDILDYACSHFKRVILNTNGTFNNEIREKLIPLLNSNLFLQFSIDGLKPIHDSIRGVGTFDAIIQNILNLQDFSSKIMLSTTATTNSIRNIIDLSKLLLKIKFRHWKISPVHGLDVSSVELIPNDVWNCFVDEILKYCPFKVIIQKRYDINLMERMLYRINKHPELLEALDLNCGTGKTKFYVLPNLDILPCTCFNTVIGNLKTLTKADISLKLRKVWDFEIPMNSPCYNCKYKIICHGGCIGNSIRKTGLPNMGDYTCPLLSKLSKEQAYQ